MLRYQAAIEATAGAKLTVLPSKSSLGLLALFEKRGDIIITSGTGGLYPPLVAIARVVKLDDDGAVALPLADPANTSAATRDSANVLMGDLLGDLEPSFLTPRGAHCT